MRSWVVLIGLLAAGCSSPKLMDTGRVSIVDASSLPPPQTSDLVNDRRQYTMGPYDKFSVTVFGLPELSVLEAQVDGNGDVSVPLAGTVTATGKTPAQLSDVIADRLRSGGVRDPKVSVNVRDMVSQAVTVDGAVKMPGVYSAGDASTMMRAIARAQGVTDFAEVDHVVVFRKVGNQSMAALYDLRAIRLGAYEDPKIYPNDVIVVGDSAARRLFPTVVQAASVLLTPLIYVLR